MFIALGRRAFIWDEENGMQILQEILENQYGLDLTGWTLVVAHAISADGNTIVGEGINPAGDDEAWVVHLGSEDSVADFNGDGVVNREDLVAFFIAYFTGDMSADINDDGILDIVDIILFLEAYHEANPHPGRSNPSSSE